MYVYACYYTKIFFNIQIYFCCFLILFAVNLYCSNDVNEFLTTSYLE